MMESLAAFWRFDILGRRRCLSLALVGLSGIAVGLVTVGCVVVLGAVPADRRGCRRSLRAFAAPRLGHCRHSDDRLSICGWLSSRGDLPALVRPPVGSFAHAWTSPTVHCAIATPKCVGIRQQRLRRPLSRDIRAWRAKSHRVVDLWPPHPR